MKTKNIRFVVATKCHKSDFYDNTLLGQCLKLYEGLYELDLYDLNVKGLPHVYNISIQKSAENPAILVFVHDDVYLMNFWWNTQIRDGLKHFDIIGVAGNSRRIANQPTWLHCYSDMAQVDYENISGCVGAGNGVMLPDRLWISGPSPMEVKLLDGVFLCCDSVTLLDSQLKFDERFDFHYYDLDFCRQAEIRGLRMGTWQIPILHASAGVLNNEWQNSKIKYFEKWGE